MARLYLVRHGEPSVTGVLCGQADPPLSGNGRAQAAAVRLPAFPVYSSPLRRAIETARLFSGDCQVVVEPGFAEISYGKWDGRSWAEIAACDPHAASAKAADWFGVTPPGGEPWDSFCSRVLAALARIRRPAIIVAHEAVNSVIVEAATGRDPRSFVQSYCEVIEVEI